MVPATDLAQFCVLGRGALSGAAWAVVWSALGRQTSTIPAIMEIPVVVFSDVPPS